MDFKINQTELDTSFRVPASIIDKHIRIANGDQLKVILWIMKNGTEASLEDMSKALRMKAEDVTDYLQYWVNCGIITECAGGQTPIAQAPAVKTPAAPKPVVTPEPVKTDSPAKAAVSPAPQANALPPYSKPSNSEIAARIEESPAISSLFREAQIKLGKTISYNTQCVLLMMHDYDGLPVEVIFMLLDYCLSIGKINDAYLAAVSRDWGLHEIDTIEKAAEKISALQTADAVWKDFAAMAGITNPRPTTSQTAYLNRWCREYGFNSTMIYLAYEEMADHTQKMSFQYMDKVLQSWYQNGIKTPEDVAAAKAKPLSGTAQNTSGTKKSGSKTSYDINEFEKSVVSTDLHYERKKKKS